MRTNQQGVNQMNLKNDINVKDAVAFSIVTIAFASVTKTTLSIIMDIKRHRRSMRVIKDIEAAQEEYKQALNEYNTTVQFNQIITENFTEE